MSVHSATPAGLPFLHERIAVVDLETTGTAATADAITEIGIVLIDHGHVVEEWSSLVNPQCVIPPEIQALTGITDDMVRDAPTFAELAEEVFARLQDRLFVAHNARFDYGFIKNAFRRLGRPFTADVLCTVRLSRKLYPEYVQHNLDSLIERHRLAAEGRHRALGDARLAWQFLSVVARDHAAETVMAATRSLLKMPSLPPQLDADALKAIPDGPGVYVFYGVNDLPIYIGKSVNLRDRVRSHFSSDHRQSNDLRLSLELRRIDFEETAGEFGALLRESQLIKSSKPLRNLRLRRNAQLVFVRLADLSRPAEIIAFDDADLENANALFGPFAARPRAREMLTRLAAEHGLCWKALGVEAGGLAEGAPCFARQIRRCLGCCVGAETLATHNARLAIALQPHRFPTWPFAGAVAIREVHPDHGWERVHVFNQWRYLGCARSEADAYELAAARAEVEFDADIFKLLVKRLAEGGAAIMPLLAVETANID
ncbi:MAG: 3'-5' exoribonuclease [Betaproteobacteria bacterium]|nr:3'-5' exoribonuclease [Betaproteobacteria bacterium]